jgi:hypothetical protein
LDIVDEATELFDDVLPTLELGIVDETTELFDEAVPIFELDGTDVTSGLFGKVLPTLNFEVRSLLLILALAYDVLLMTLLLFEGDNIIMGGVVVTLFPRLIFSDDHSPAEDTVDSSNSNVVDSVVVHFNPNL